MTRYPLAALLSVREREEAGARAELADAIAAEGTRAEARAGAAARLAAHAARLDAATAPDEVGAGAAGALAAGARHADRLRAEQGLLARALLEEDAALGRARVDVEAARAALAQARRAVLAVERHRGAWLGERRRARERREEAEADERGSGGRA